MILVDTNVFSELQKTSPDPRVVGWLHAHRTMTALSTVVIAEIRMGIALTSGLRKRTILEGWLNRIILEHRAGRTFDFDTAAALKYGEITAALQLDDRSVGAHDAMIAAQALANGLPIATRNTKHFQHPEVELIDPWEA